MNKLISAALAVLTLSVFAFSTSAAETSFTDLDSYDPSKEAIEYLQANGTVEGYEDGTFRSINKMNRAEFAKVIVEEITDDISGSDCFTDVSGEWYAKYVCTAKDLGIIDGHPDGTYRPGDEINFAEASKVVVNAFGIEPTTTNSEDPWYREFVEALDEQNGIPLSISDLDKEIARGEMSEVVWRIQEEVQNLDSLKYEELEGEPVFINSCQELKDLFFEYDYYYPVPYAMDESIDFSAGAESESGSAESKDFSTTNVQVAGVDEADIVKNDARYIYTIGDDYVVHIVDTENGLSEIAQIDLTGESDFLPSKLYLDGDQLVVMGSLSNYSYYEYGFADIWFPGYHESRTSVDIFDVSNPSQPALERHLEFDGYHQDSRKVDDTIYLITSDPDIISYSYGFDEADIEAMNAEEILPRYSDSLGGEEVLADCTDIRYFPRERNLSYLNTIAIPMDGGSIDSEVMIASSENIYASRENLYVAATNYDSNDYYFDWNNARTIVLRFGLDAGKVSYQASGKVDGTILDQFSMDEHENYFRISTTEGSSWNDTSTNNVFILDQDMSETGSVRDIAPGEVLHSTRFIGDKGYLVTFKKIDPFFVLDLSNPFNPQILGELKIPGYSDYLHPYDENHIIGFGKDATDAEEELIFARDLDFAWFQGIKVALFDVTDPSNPTQLYSVGIGDRGSESQVLSDHKALLFDASKNLLAFPVTVTEVEEGAPVNTYGDAVFQGAHIFDLSLENGFSLDGTITHYDTYDGYGYYYNEKDIDRIIYIGDTFYTISGAWLKANDMDSLAEEGFIEL